MAILTDDLSEIQQEVNTGPVETAPIEASADPVEPESTTAVDTKKAGYWDQYIPPKIEKDPNAPTLGQTFGAAFRQHNIIGSAFQKLRTAGQHGQLGKIAKTLVPFHQTTQIIEDIITPEDPNFNPNSLIESTELAQYATQFYGVKSQEEFDYIADGIRKRQADAEILRNSGGWGLVASIAAGVLDPTILIPVTTVPKAAVGLGKVATILTKSAIGAGLGASAAFLQEGTLKALQPERDPQILERSLIIGAIAGGILGPLAGTTAKNTVKSSVSHIIDNGGVDIPYRLQVPSSTSASAAEVGIKGSMLDHGLANLDFRYTQRILDSAGTGLEKIGIKSLRNKLDQLKKFGGVGDAIVADISSPFKGLRSPIIRGSTSKFSTVKTYTAHMFENSLWTKAGMKGAATEPAESFVHYGFAQSVKGQRASTLSYKSLVQSAKKGSSVISYDEFNDAVAYAMRNGDTHVIPQVEATAKMWRNKLEPLVKEMQELDILGKELDPTTASSYFSRKYNISKILDNREGFLDILRRNFIKRNGIDALEADSMANDTLAKILNQGDDAFALQDLTSRLVSSKPVFTKSRTLLIPDNELAPFLDNNAQEVMSNYIMRAYKMIGFKKALKSQGFDTFADAKKALVSEKDFMIHKFPEESKYLERAFSQDSNLLDDMTNIVLGRIRADPHTSMARGLRHFGKYMTATRLGGVTLSSMPDMAMPTFKWGLPKYIKDGILSLKFFKYTRDELIDAGVALEVEMNRVLRGLSENSFDMSVRAAKIDRFDDAVMKIFGKATGMSYWNYAHKYMAANMSQSNILRVLFKGNKTPQEIAELSSLGIGSDMYERILTQFHKWGETSLLKARQAHWHLWDDPDAIRVFSNAVRRDVESTILMPGMGDLPIFAQKSSIGSMILKFKSFSATATNKLLLKGIQKRDMNVVLGFTYLLGLGYLSYVVKSYVAGREPKGGVNVALMEGLTRSGMMGLMGDYIAALAPGSTGSRYQNLRTIDTILGPGTGMIKDISAVFYNGFEALTNENTEFDLGKLRRIMPFANLFYLQQIMTRVFDGENPKKHSSSTDKRDKL